MLSTTVKNYIPSRYQETKWEVISNNQDQRDFQMLELEVISSRPYQEDPVFESFDPQDPKRQMPQPGESEAPVIDPEVEQAKIAAQLEEQFNAGKAAGIEQGRQEVEERFQQQLQELKDKNQQLHVELNQQLAKFYATVEKEAVGLSLQVAKKILVTTAQFKPDYIVDVIRLALQSLGAAKPVKIRMSRDDLEFVQVIGLPVELSAEELGIEYVADDMIKTGCIVDTDFGEVDLQLDMMWEQVAGQLTEI